jgi:hypothetical protein
MKSDIEGFNKIEQAEVPEFMYARIQQRIALVNNANYSPRIFASLSVAFLLILVMNTMVIVQQIKSNSQEQTLVQDMHLMNQNALY